MLLSLVNVSNSNQRDVEGAVPYLSSVGEENLAPPPTNSIDTPFFLGAT